MARHLTSEACRRIVAGHALSARLATDCVDSILVQIGVEDKGPCAAQKTAQRDAARFYVLEHANKRGRRPA